MRYDEDERPEELTDWLRAGIRRTEAMTWRRWNFTLEEATAWMKVGVTAGLAAAQWRTAGVTPTTMRQWRDAGISATEAVHWHEMGFTLEQAKEHKRHGRRPETAFQLGQSAAQVGSMQARVPQNVQRFAEAGIRGELMHGYLRAQWLDDTALGWAKAGIEVHDARLWSALGVTPAEASELVRKEMDPVSVMEDWWRAGIPFEEVGSWLGAGLTPKEAAAQRANGVTAEQAAALRALRRPEQD